MVPELQQAEIRILNSNDLQAFKQLRLLGLQSDPAAFGQTPEEFSQMEDEDLIRWITPTENGLILGIFIDGILVGMAGIRREARLRSRHKGIIWGVYVHPKHRGKSHARRLLLRLIEAAHENMVGVEQLILSVSERQPQARALYTALGFKIYGTEPRALFVDGDYVAEDHMWFKLSTP